MAKFSHGNMDMRDLFYLLKYILNPDCTLINFINRSNTDQNTYDPRR